MPKNVLYIILVVLLIFVVAVLLSNTRTSNQGAIISPTPHDDMIVVTATEAPPEVSVTPSIGGQEADISSTPSPTIEEEIDEIR